MPNLSPENMLAAARYLAREKTPYFAAALMGLVPRPAPWLRLPNGFPTIAVTAQAVLLYNPEAVTAWTVPQLAGALIHEIGHLLRKHHDRFAHCTQPETRQRANMAGDLSMNDDIKAMGFELPNGAIHPSTFNLKPNLTAEEYYRLLERNPPPPQQGGGKGKQGGSGSGGEHAPGCAGGHCGGAAGNPFDGEPDEQDPAGRSEAEIERISRQVAEQMRQASNGSGAGNVPAGWLRWAEDVTKPPKVRWEEKLRRRLRAGVAHTAGAVDHTYNRVSRRQAGIGYGPGKPVLPALHAPVPEVDVVVDTSGSMGDGEISAALREIAGIMASTGSRVRFSACDAQVHSLATVTRWQEILPLLKGGGGTLFQPVFDQLMSQRRKPAVIVFATDGGCFDQPNDPGVPVIWLLVGAHRCKVPVDWGHVIGLDD